MLQLSKWVNNPVLQDAKEKYPVEQKEVKKGRGREFQSGLYHCHLVSLTQLYTAMSKSMERQRNE